MAGVPVEADISDELNAVVQRVELRGDLRPVRQVGDREERSGDQEQGRQNR